MDVKQFLDIVTNQYPFVGFDTTPVLIWRLDKDFFKKFCDGYNGIDYEINQKDSTFKIHNINMLEHKINTGPKFRAVKICFNKDITFDLKIIKYVYIKFDKSTAYLSAKDKKTLITVKDIAFVLKCSGINYVHYFTDLQIKKSGIIIRVCD